VINTIDRDGILADIIAEPSSDTARHVYADWMEEFGGAAGARRAEFVRAQLDNKWDVEVEPSWDGPLMGWWSYQGTPGPAVWFDDGLKGMVRIYRRGFVRRVEMPLYDWFKRGPELVRTLPLEEVRATHRKPWDIGHANPPHGTYSYLWYLTIGAPHAAGLPQEVYELLDSCSHPDEASAMADLSRALLKWARKQF
jgi:uncharacterized protein (TIGR02996 family)